MNIMSNFRALIKHVLFKYRTSKALCRTFNFSESNSVSIKKYSSGVLLALGDSYTTMSATHFLAFAKKHGLICDNRGLASSTIAGSADGVTVGYHAFWKRLDEAVTEYSTGHILNGKMYHNTDVKLVTFMGGANDWFTVDSQKGIDRLGTPESENKEQLYGACKYIFTTLLSAFPNADIVVILQPTNLARILGHWKKECIIRDMASLYGLPICDCCFSWFHPANPNDLATYWSSDKLHLTEAGKDALFSKLEETVNHLPFERNK